MTRRKVEAWAVVHHRGGIVGLFFTKEEALSYSLQGVRWRVVKLVPHSPAKEKLVRAAVAFVDAMSKVGGIEDLEFKLRLAVARYKRERRK